MKKFIAVITLLGLLTMGAFAQGSVKPAEKKRIKRYNEPWITPPDSKRIGRPRDTPPSKKRTPTPPPKRK